MQELKNRVEEKMLECISKAEESFGRDFPMIPVRYDLKGRCAGQFCTRYGSSYLRVNTVLLTENVEHYIAQTIPHEVAHYINRVTSPFASAHGNEWKNIMTRIMGVRADRCHSYDTSNARQGSKTTKRFTYKCGCKTHELSTVRHNRIVRRGTVYTCKKCKVGLTRV